MVEVSTCGSISNVDRSTAPNSSQQSLSRRALLKRGASIAGKLIIAASLADSTIGSVRDQRIPFEDTYELLTGGNAEYDPLVLVRDVEQKYNIRLISIFDAYKKIGIPFDQYDRDSLGDVVPARWDHDRVEMIGRLLSVLPEFFYGNSGDGERLHIALTNYGEKSLAGEYRTLPLREDVMLLDMDSFSPQNERAALDLLCHESIHRVQESSGSSRLAETAEDNTGLSFLYNPKIEKFIEGKSFKALCKDALDVLEQSEPSNDGALEAYKSKLWYAVKDILGDKEARGLPFEFEASMGEFYLHGHEYFIRYGSIFFEENNARHIYNYMRDEIFRGFEYDRYPLEEPLVQQNKRSVDIFNNVVARIVPQETISEQDIPWISIQDYRIQTLDNLSHTLAYELFDQKDGRKLETISWKGENGDEIPITAWRELDDNGVSVEGISFKIGNDGKRVKRATDAQKLSKEHLKELAGKVFPLVREFTFWREAKDVNNNHFIYAIGGNEDRPTHITLDQNGQITYYTGTVSQKEIK